MERAERPLFASRPIERDVATNLTGIDGRIYLIVLDDLHTWAQRSSRVRQAARLFVERYVGANDLVAVVHTSGRSDAGQDFTNNRAPAAGGGQVHGPQGAVGDLNRIDQEYMTRGTRDRGDRIDDIDDRERGYQARIMLESMQQLTQCLGGVSGRRKALVLFSEGIDYDISDPINNQDATMVLNWTRDLLSAATRANVAIYGVDPRGLGGLAESPSRSPPTRTTPRWGLARTRSGTRSGSARTACG